MSGATKGVRTPEMRVSPMSAPALDCEPETRGARPSICHISSVRGSLDARIFYLQCVPSAKERLVVRLLGPHALRGTHEGVGLVSLKRRANRLVRIVSAPLVSFEALRQHSDVYHLHDPELLPLGMLLKIGFGKRVVYDAEEDYPSMMLTKTWTRPWLRGAFAAAVDVAERIAALCFSGLVTADPRTLRRLAKTGRSRKLVFYNFPCLELFSSRSAAERKFDLVYRGGLSERAGTLVLLEAMELLAKQGRPVRLLLIGYCDAPEVEARIRVLIKSRGLSDQVEMRGRIPHADMAAALGLARIGVSPLLPVPKFLRNIPVKVWEYWACGLPVVASDLPPIRPFFRDREYGLLVKPGDAEALARAIRQLLDNPCEAERMGLAGRRAVQERYHNEGEVKKLLSFYQRILSDQT